MSQRNPHRAVCIGGFPANYTPNFRLIFCLLSQWFPSTFLPPMCHQLLLGCASADLPQMSACALCQGDSDGHACSLCLAVLCQAFCAPSLPHCAQSPQFASIISVSFTPSPRLSADPESHTESKYDQNKVRAKSRQMVTALFTPFLYQHAVLTQAARSWFSLSSVLPPYHSHHHQVHQAYLWHWTETTQLGSEPRHLGTS